MARSGRPSSFQSVTIPQYNSLDSLREDKESVPRNVSGEKPKGNLGEVGNGSIVALPPKKDVDDEMGMRGSPKTIPSSQ